MSHRELALPRGSHVATGRKTRRLLPCGCRRATARKMGHRPECDYHRPEQTNAYRWRARVRHLLERDCRQ